MGFRLEHANICVRDIEPSARAESARLSGFERRTRVLLALNQPNRAMILGKSKDFTMSRCVCLDLGESSQFCFVWFR